jgi:hypothetical protein
MIAHSFSEYAVRRNLFHKLFGDILINLKGGKGITIIFSHNILAYFIKILIMRRTSVKSAVAYNITLRRYGLRQNRYCHCCSPPGFFREYNRFQRDRLSRILSKKRWATPLASSGLNRSTTKVCPVSTDMS